MNFRNRLVCRACVVALGLVLGGCSPSDSGSQNELKEPHFVLGQSRVNAMDYDGAREAFEQSLEVNPHSAQAHFQLAMLYEQKLPDPAAAIYHYERYLKYDPSAGNADLITQRIETCKQQLAANVLLLPSSSSAQQQIQQLANANRRLQEQLNWWQTQYTNLLVAARLNTPVAQPAPDNPPPQPQPEARAPGRNVPPRDNQTPARPVTVSGRTHTVAAGETAVAIARKYHFKLSALQAANPGVNLSRIRVGQSLKLP